MAENTTQVTVERLVNLGNYSHAKVAITDSLRDGETTMAALARVTTQVNEGCLWAIETRDLRDAIHDGKWNIRLLDELAQEDQGEDVLRQLEDARKRIEHALDIAQGLLTNLHVKRHDGSIPF